MANTSIFSFVVGNVPCWSVSDGTAYFEAAKFFANAASDALLAALPTLTSPSDVLPTALNCLLMRLHNQMILVDTGLGPNRQPGTGQLIANLGQLGLTPDAIDWLILSHAHGDHMGGAFDADEQPVFRRAQVVTSRREWEHWRTQPETHPIRQRLESLHPRLVEDGETILPGLTARLVPGHTPGQMGVIVRDEGESLRYTADVIAHPMHVSHSEWHIAADVEPEVALRTRELFLAEAAQEHTRLFVYHFPAPGLYVIRVTESGYTTERAK